jgi:quinol monooxygenase YgiN
MIIITGTITASEATIDELLTLSLEHVRRSRAEPGCLSHGVSRDVENPLRLIFFEQWEDMAAVKVHFAVTASGEFGKAAVALGAAPPTLDLYDATSIQDRRSGSAE